MGLYGRGLYERGFYKRGLYKRGLYKRGLYGRGGQRGESSGRDSGPPFWFLNFNIFAFFCGRKWAKFVCHPSHFCF